MSACPHEAVPPSTRADLEGITKLSTLQKRARDAGVDGAKVDEAVDAEDPRQVLIELIIEKEASQVDPAAALRAELGGITKLSALQKRARDAGVDGAKVDEAVDAEDPRQVLIELILEAAKNSVVKPHYGVILDNSSGSVQQDGATNEIQFGDDKYCMSVRAAIAHSHLSTALLVIIMSLWSISLEWN